MYERIKALAKEHGWSMSYLASKINRSSAYFTDVKNGKATIPDDKLKEIANYLNCSVDYLLGRVDNPIPKNYNENPSLNNNTIKILGRDGTNIEKTLTDDEIEVFKKLISSLPDAEDL